MRAAASSPLVLALVLVAAGGAARAQDPVLVLRRDWTPSTCSLANVTCREHPDSFSIDGLFHANWATGEALTACTGKPPLALPELEAAGLSLDDVACAFQNYDPDTTSLEPVWRYQWEQFGACTSAGTAADYFRLGLDLDQRFPLPQDIATMTTGLQLAAAIQAAFNATPFVVCEPADGLLRNIQLCFEPASGAIQSCPWAVQPGCNGPLRVPRTGRGPGFPACQAYYLPSPVSALLGASSPPTQPVEVAAPAPAPAAAAEPPPSPSPSPPESPPPASPPPVPPPSPAPPSPAPPPSPRPPSPAPSPSPPSPSPGTPPPDRSPSPPLPPPPSPDNQASPELVPLDASGSGSTSSSGGTSTGTKVGALVGGIAGGMLLGGAVIAVSYRAYTRCSAGGGKASAGSTSGPLLEAGGASDTPRQALPLYSSRLAAVPE